MREKLGQTDMKKLARKGGVRYWALVISLVVHGAALAVFAGVKLSSRADEPAPVRSGLSMEMIEKAVAQSPPKPKPKVKPIDPLIEPEKEHPKPLVAEESAPVAAVVAPVEAVPTEPLWAEPMTEEVEFFGQRSVAQRVCYVVDCSGSMYGQMHRVKARLKVSIRNLTSQQGFTVLFFTEGRQILMSGSGRLTAATVSAKSEALALIETIRPGGTTDAEHALECAMRLRDSGGNGPDVIYFLTDGFDLDEEGALRFVEKIESHRKLLAPSVVLNTIGCEPRENDRKMLDVLARLTGGGYTEVK